MYTGQTHRVDVDFAACNTINDTTVGGFEEKKRLILQVHSAASYYLGMAEAWARQARKDSLDSQDLDGVNSASAKAQGIQQDQQYVSSSNAVDVLTRFRFDVEWNLKLLQSSNANQREELKTY